MRGGGGGGVEGGGGRRRRRRRWLRRRRMELKVPLNERRRKKNCEFEFTPFCYETIGKHSSFC